MVGGIGKSGLVGQKISATLSSTGTPSHFMHPTEALHGDLGRIRAEDVVLLLSYSGQTEEVLSLAALVRQDSVPLVSMVGNPDCHLARLSDAALCLGVIREACPLDLAPTASTTAMLALGDALALAVSRARNFTAEQFQKRHPGGHLGRKMLPLADVIRFRAGVNLPVVSDELSVSEVLQAAAKFPRRAGAVVLVDNQQQLSGIFTDADLRRLVTENSVDGLQQPIRSLMTQQPQCLKATDLVRDAVQLVRESRIDEIPIIDESGSPVGLLDVQDLVALKVIEDV